MTIKTEQEIELMREGGVILAGTLKALLHEARPGTTLQHLDQLAYEHIIHAQARPSFLGYEGFPATLCASVNEGVVHGIPNGYALREGDILGLDLGVYYHGFHTDLSESIIVGNPPENQDTKRKRRFLEVGRTALSNAIEKACTGMRIGDISNAIQNTIEDGGYSIIRELTGHAVGKKLHEDPLIPGYGRPHAGELLRNGQALAIEVIYAERKPQIEILNDGWTIVTRDGSLGGLFERTVIVRRDRAEILTLV